MDVQRSQMLETWSQEYRRAAAEDGYTRILVECNRDPDWVEDAQALGQQLTETNIRVVTMVLAFRSLGTPVDASELRWTARFLGMQRYGAEGSGVGAAYRLRISGLDLGLTFGLDRIGDVDLEDLYEVFPIYDLQLWCCDTVIDDVLASRLRGELAESLGCDQDEIEPERDADGGSLTVVVHHL